MRIDDGDAAPARLGIDPFEVFVSLVVRDRHDHRLGLLRQPRDEVGRRRDPVANQHDRRACLKAAQRLLHVADWKDADSVEPQPLERILKRLRHALDDDDDGRSPGCRGAANLIFDQGSSGERDQRAEAALIILLIGPDQSADRQSRPSPLPHARQSLSNCFRASSKMVN